MISQESEAATACRAQITFGVTNRDGRQPNARILDAVMTVATNAGAAPELRIASLRVLASYGDRRVWVSLEDLQSRRTSGKLLLDPAS